jgi:hypothetical protein
MFTWALAVTMFSFGAASRSGPGGDAVALDRARARMVADQIAARNNGTTLVNALRLIHVTAAAAAPVAEAYSLLDGTSGSRPTATPFSVQSLETPSLTAAPSGARSLATAALFGITADEAAFSRNRESADSLVDEILFELMSSGS